MTDLEMRFWDKVRIGDGCWEWTRHIAGGYGVFSVGMKSKKAHRVSWELAFGEIPEGMCICHRCDNRKCVRPGHLFIGTNRENTADRHAKGRDAKGIMNGAYTRPETRARGTANGASKLTEAEVVEIRRLIDGGMTRTEAGKRFGISQVMAGKIYRRELWRHVK